MSTISSAYENLYSAQFSGKAMVGSTSLKAYSPNYINSQKGVYWLTHQSYDLGRRVTVGAIGLAQGSCELVNYIAMGVLSTADFLLGWAVRPIMGEVCRLASPLGSRVFSIFDAIYPVNIVNGERHLVLIPRRWEKWVGEHVFYPLGTSSMIDSYDEEQTDQVQTVVQKLVGANEELLNDVEKAEDKFNYRVRLISSNTLNAFATPGGGMVVFDGLVKAINGEIKKQKIQNSTITLEDGSELTLDLSKVTADDVLAALIGHEMTHVASRHSIAALVSILALDILLSVSRFIGLEYLKSKNPDYQRLKDKQERSQKIAFAPKLTEVELVRLQNLEKSFKNLNSFLEWLCGKTEILGSLFNSRANEYEADITGMYLAKRAGYNPLGAIWLQEFLLQKEGSAESWLHRNFEALFAHPACENRKKALLGAVYSFLNDRYDFDSTTAPPFQQAVKLDTLDDRRECYQPLAVRQQMEVFAWAKWILST